jgi:hypothetical protein
MIDTHIHIGQFYETWYGPAAVIDVITAAGADDTVNADGDPLKINEHFCKVAALNRRIVLDWKEKLQA